MLPDILRISLQERITKAHDAREAAIDVLKMIQDHYGWLSDESIDQAADLLGLSALQVDELATFYEMLYRQPVGRYVLHVCDSISCWAVGGETLLKTIEEMLAIKAGQTTSDNRITLLPCSCLGNCGDGPAVMVGSEIHVKMTPEKMTALFAHLS